MSSYLKEKAFVYGFCNNEKVKFIGQILSINIESKEILLRNSIHYLKSGPTFINGGIMYFSDIVRVATPEEASIIFNHPEYK